jgi:hypothetical protein
MGKLTDLVGYRNELASKVDSLNLHKAITKKINILEQVQVNNSNVNYNIELINNNYKQLSIDNDNNIGQLNELIKLVNTDITTLATTLFSNRELPAYTKRVNLPSDELLRKLVKSKIRQYCDWHYPGLQISCNSNEWIDCMVTSDPLYLTDSQEDRAVDIQLSNLISDYPLEYRNRLRLYSVTGHDFSALPLAQFSIIVCWDFLNYIELASIAEYMRQMFTLLRAGGVFMFSYNNCDIIDSASLAEGNGMSWASASAIKQLCNDIGYEIITFEDHVTEDTYIKHVSWCEIRKPGVLTTVKAHQVAGKILEK